MPPTLLIIADDLTGANDTGVQFAKQGIETLVVIDAAQFIAPFVCQVLVVNTESRHLNSDEAYQRVYNVVQQGVQLGIPQFYKKTDSTLRGNIGSELAALIEATGEQSLFFAPAYPQLKRTTRRGTQSVNGVPLHHSSFARDPFNPVSEASIAAIIAQQSDLAVAPFASYVSVSDAPTIYVVDAETDEDLRTIARLLHHQKLLAGSAGLAEFLPAAMQLPTARVPPPTLSLPMLIVNGSLHEASLQQVAHAAQNGWTVIEATPATTAAPVVAAIATKQRVILTTSPELLCEQFTQHLANLVAQILDQITIPAVAVFGGDTLAAIADARGWTAFRPRTEFLPGVPLVQVGGQDDLLLLTKAGGFGNVDLIVKIQQSTEP